MKRIYVLSLLFFLVATTAFADISNAECSGPTITIGTAKACNQGSQVYAVSVNTDTSQRTGTITIAGETFTVSQGGECAAWEDVIKKYQDYLNCQTP